MSFNELSRDEYLHSVKKIDDFSTLKFSKQALELWDEYFSWKNFPPITLSMDGINKSYLFYHVSKDNRYLTIHNLFTPKIHRQKGFAHKLLAELFRKKSGCDIERFKLLCAPSSLKFYNSLGLSYWGVNEFNLYYCDFKMPKKSITEIDQIVTDSSINEFTHPEYEKIYHELEADGDGFNEKQTDIYLESKKILGKRYMHKSFLKSKI